MDIDFDSLDPALIEHAKKIIDEATALREDRISYRVLIKEYKPRWEREAQRIINKTLNKPIALLGKDSGYVPARGAEWVCVCDLLDGSLNFVCGLKYYAYSVALAHKKDFVYGLVIDLHDMIVYRAVKGQGAFMKNIKNETTVDLSEMRREIPDSYDMETINVKAKFINSIDLHCSSLELCIIAGGGAEVAIGKSWVPDIAGGYVIAKEAGISFVDWEFKPIETLPIDYQEIRFIAGTPKVLAELQTRIDRISDLLILE
ncbi:MAG: hypothetical protein DRJ38_05400 [Thermoprotei archaeon]|nr:MAG: hypothetical protein DRJ38_05400 [Thermoprotei archaeon]